MKVSVQSINFNIDKDLVKFIEKKISVLDKFYDNIVGSEVFLKVENTSEKENKLTEIKISIPGNDIVVKKQGKSFEEGVSLAVDAIKRQVVKRKEKQRA